MFRLPAAVRRVAQRIDVHARALDQRMLADQLRRYPLGALERERYLRFVDEWGGLRGWLLFLLALLLLTAAGLLVAALSGMPKALAVIVTLGLGWMGLAVWLGWLLPSIMLKAHPRRPRSWWLAVVVMAAGAAVGWLVARLTMANDPGAVPDRWRLDLAQDWPSVLAALVVGALLVQALMQGTARLRARFDRDEAERLRQENQAQRQQLELAQTRAREQQMEIALAQSHLQMLRAQIEPHFIFNTLGAVQQLAENGAPAAARLVAQLTTFLRAAMPQLRRADTTLSEERALVEAYLGIMATRIGPRLRWQVEVEDDAGLADCRLPPALLLTLVENAIKHGVEPCRATAEIAVRVRSAGAGTERQLWLQVADTGVGLAASGAGSSGVGLANLRDQLHTLYGDEASLELAENRPQGFVATLRLPCPADKAFDGATA